MQERARQKTAPQPVDIHWPLNFAQSINLCEMKYSTQEYTITKETDEKLRHKRNDFMHVTGTKSAVRLTVVTTYGLTQNSYAGNIQSVITADELFW